MHSILILFSDGVQIMSQDVLSINQGPTVYKSTGTFQNKCQIFCFTYNLVNDIFTNVCLLLYFFCPFRRTAFATKEEKN